MILAFLRTFAAWIFTAVYWPLPLVFHVLTLRQWIDASVFVRAWGRAILWILNIQIDVEGKDCLLERRTRVVVSNHQSTLDLAWGAVVCPCAPLAIGKREVVFIPILNLIWWALGFMRIDRKNRTSALRRLEGVAQRMVTEKLSLVMAPEGTRSRDGRLGAFKKGAFHLAIAAQAEIVPLVVRGAYELMPPSNWLAYPGHLRVRILDPISTQGLTPADVGNLTERVRKAVEAAL